MESDNRQAALKQLLIIAAQKGYITFDDITMCADAQSLSIGELDWLTDSVASRNIIIYDEAPKTNDSEDTEYDDYAQIDYEQVYADAIAMCPELETIINEIRRIKPPQRGEVKRLKYQVREGNSHARKRMIEMHLRVAVKNAVARSKAYDTDLADTFGDAVEGLIIAIDKYDPDYSGPISSYASMWMLQNISRRQRTRNSVVFFPMHRKERYLQIFPYLKEWGCTECGDLRRCVKLTGKICKKIQCTQETASDIINAFIPMLSWEELEANDDNNSELYYSEDDILKNFNLELLKEAVGEALYHLTPREAKIVRSKYGLNDGKVKTLEQVGKKMGVTRERVRQIEAKAIRKLKRSAALYSLYLEDI